MGIIWVVEKPDSETESIAKILMGNFPVRCVASLDSFTKLIKISNHLLPKVVLFNLKGISYFIENIENLLDDQSSPTTRIFVTKERVSRLPQLTRQIQSPSYTYDLSYPEIELTKVISSIMETEAVKTYEPKGLISYKDIEFDCNSYEFQIVPGGEKENLPLKEARLLKYFMENPGKCLTREEIRKSVWLHVKVASRTIDSHISRLRKRISFGEVQIESIYGGGYVLK